jgi:hypothetical protein
MLSDESPTRHDYFKALRHNADALYVPRAARRANRLRNWVSDWPPVPLSFAAAAFAYVAVMLAFFCIESLRAEQPPLQHTGASMPQCSSSCRAASHREARSEAAVRGGVVQGPLAVARAVCMPCQPTGAAVDTVSSVPAGANLVSQATVR